MGLLEMIIVDSEREEKKALEAENTAQADYELFLKNSAASIEAAHSEIANRSEALAKADGDKTMAEADLKNTITDVANLKAYNGQLHGDCDYLLKNYEERQTSRAAEIESLKEAKAIFSGASFGL